MRRSKQQEGSPRKSVRSTLKKRVSNLNINSAQAISKTDFLNHASGAQLARFVQDPVAASQAKDEFSNELSCMASKQMM